MKNALKTVFINLMVFAVFFIGIELLGQLGYILMKKKFLASNLVNQSEVFEKHPYLVGRPKASVTVTKEGKTITTTNVHTRWTGANPDDKDLIRIGVFGGSTTFGTGVTDKDSWPALLQKELGNQYAIINYGVPGYSTAENVVQMALIAPEKQPHIVVFYEGWNDIRNYHTQELGADYYGHGIKQYESLNIPNASRLKDIFKNTFSTVWFTDWISRKIKNKQKLTVNTFEEPDHFVDKIYLRNLKTLKMLSNNIEARPIFIPQVLNYKEFNERKEITPWSKHIKNKAMSSLMNRFNTYMNELCFDEEEGMVLNDVLEQNWDSIDFVDEGHFSKSGGEKFSQIVAHYIRKIDDQKTVKH